ncbi:MAG: thioredoxin-disulfide reductase [Holosporaceae bacterium]|jgi:thioredoxin reductase (NADPH)|nr:thioredoxin-disulfide reductase [Holosporaceae bacterium]
MEIADILVIGSGPAGYTAAIYGARAGRSVRIISGQQPGGQLMITSFIENYPGFVDPISGPFLMDQMKSQAEKVGAEIISDTIVSVDFSEQPLLCRGESGVSYEGKTVVIATGANAKWLGIPGEEKYRGAGVSACATCDGFFFRNRDVAVIGGGNAAVEEAIYLTNFARSVALVHRRDQLRAEKIMQERLFANGKIEVLWNMKVIDILGDGNKVTDLLLASTSTSHSTSHSTSTSASDNGEVKKPIDGVFVAIGHQPATSIFDGKLEIDENGYIITEGKTSRTSVPGVFAAGDVCDPHYRQAVVSAGQGCIAAIDADRFLSSASKSFV